MSIGRDLAQLRIPVETKLGGVSPGYIDGLDWSITGNNTVIIGTGTAYCPYSSGGRIVVLTAPVTIDLGVGTALTRVHLWLHNDNGTATVAADASSLENNYYGNAYSHTTNTGWRYLGSVQRGSGGGAPSQRVRGDTFEYMTAINIAPYEMINTTTTTTARAMTTDNVAPGSVTSIRVTVHIGNSTVTRFAPSQAIFGQPVSTTAFLYPVLSSSVDLNIAVGSDRQFQYISDTAGSSLIVRCTGYTFRR
jgi:hypothetical protein